MKNFIKEWGQTHEEICSNLGYDENSADDLLIDDYFYIKNVWIPKSSSLYSEKEQEIADKLQG